MRNLAVKYIDQLNIGLILLTCVLAHILPYHLLLFSYAVLGPAHYLTQISWLHDRRYFANSVLMAPVMGVFSLLLLALQFWHSDMQSLWPAFIISAALCLALVSVLPLTNAMRCLVACILGVFLVLLSFYSPFVVALITLLLPTVIHIFLFTALFMWVGARKSGKKSAYLSVAVLLIGAVTFLVPSLSGGAGMDLPGINFFKPVVAFLQTMGLSSISETQLFGFLAYAYTYHYLNWFSKAEVIHWNKIPRERVEIIVTLYAVTLSAYLYNYAVGFLIAYTLSFMHVLLEFPLNIKTLAALSWRKA